jgi:hypothetical protein
MYNYIMSFLSNKTQDTQEYPPFCRDFRKGYKNGWIQAIADYKP